MKHRKHDLRSLVLAIGNDWRHDDGAGPELARALEGRVPAGTEIRLVHGAIDLLAAWDGYDEVFVVDASRSHAPAGTVHRFEVHRGDPVPERALRGSTHEVGVAEAIELGRRLERLPERLTVYSIEGAEFSDGRGLSGAVAAAVARLADQLVLELAGEAV